MATQALAANGAKVYICGRRKEALDRVVEVYSPQVEGQIIALPGDVTNKDDIKRLAEEIKQREGGLHILVRPRRSPFLTCSTGLGSGSLTCTLPSFLLARSQVNNAGISGEVTKFDEEKPSAELLSERLMKEQTFEGWNEVFQTNVSSCASSSLSPFDGEGASTARERRVDR